MFKSPWRVVFLAAGLSVVGLLLWRIDLDVALGYAADLGWGAIMVLLVYHLSFLADTRSWQMILGNSRGGFRWFHHLWKVRMVGAAVTRVTPFVGLAGEPVKAVLLHRHYGFSYSEAVSSLVAAKTVNLISLIVFLGMGLAAASSVDWLPVDFGATAVIGFAALALGISVLFFVQVTKVTSRIGPDRLRWSSLLRIVESVRRIEDQLATIYLRDPPRILAAGLLTLLNWLLGTVELWLVLYFLGHPIGILDALCIDAGVELVRAATFFIPASLGAQEGIIVLLVSALTGQAPLGLAVALIRRLREAVWVVWGGAIAWSGFNRSMVPLPDLSANTTGREDSETGRVQR